MKRIYFDYAASTPVDAKVLKVMAPYFGVKFGNAGSLHCFGQEAAAALEESREKILKIIGGAGELIFTGSATEANNLALRGAVKAFKASATRTFPRVIVSAIEHESVLETCRDLERYGVEVVYLPVSREGAVDLRKLKKSLNERTILVSVMFANNEIGAIQPIADISKIIKAFRARRLTSKGDFQYPIFHTDAVQAFQFLDCGVEKNGADLMTLSAHKIYGPKGIGALYARSFEKKRWLSRWLSPMITGGNQEFGRRGGTVNVAGAVAFAKAAELTAERREKEGRRLGVLRGRLWRGIQKIFPKAEANGVSFGSSPASSAISPPPAALPNILNVYFPGRRAQELLVEMDLAGIAVSAGAACSAYASKPSHVIAALGFKNDRASESLRFSFGAPTNESEIDEALKRIARIFKKKK